MLARYGFFARDARPIAACARPLRPDLARLASRLPQLGCVLCCACAPAGGMTAVRDADGVLLVDDPRLRWLCATARVEARCAVTRAGPREWLRFEDAGGAVLACVYLLPDTDFLAWDALLSACGDVAPSGDDAQVVRRVQRRADLLRFRCLRVGRLTALGSESAARVSPLGRTVAGEIAGDRRGVPA